MASFKLGSSSLQPKHLVGGPFRGGCPLLKRKETTKETICKLCELFTPPHPTTFQEHPATPHHSTAQHTPTTAQHSPTPAQHSTAQRTAHPTSTQTAQHSTHSAQHTHPTHTAHSTDSTGRTPAQATHAHSQHSTANTAQHSAPLPCLCVPVCLSVCLCVCVCGLCVRALSCSDSKCFCAVFCAVFPVCVLFLVNFNCLLFQVFACLFAQRARFMVTRCANCDLLCFVTDSPTHNPPTPTHETHQHPHTAHTRTRSHARPHSL